jgi:hypothetical protein
VFIKINYSPKAEEIIVGVNISLKGYSSYLSQRDIKLKKFALYNIRVVFNYKLRESITPLNKSIEGYLRF